MNLAANAFRLVAVSTALYVAGPAGATVINTYSDPTAWQGAMLSYNTINFSGFAMNPGNVVNYNTSAGLTVNGVQFVGQSGPSSYALSVINPQTGWGSNFGSGSVLRGPAYSTDGFNQALIVNLPAGVTAFGLDLMSQDPSALSFKIVLSTGEFFVSVGTSPWPNRAFFGLTSTVPISQIQFIMESGNDPTVNPLLPFSFPLMDNFSTGVAYVPPPPPPPVTAPEATTMLYVATGVFLVFFNWKRVRRLRITQ